MTRREKAMALFKEGYNCAQAVYAAFADILNIEEKDAARLASPFGGGFGRQREVCGAVSGMCLVFGALYGNDDPHNAEGKMADYAAVQKLCASFRERCGGSIICRELLAEEGKDTKPTPDARTEAYYQKRPCAELVGEAAEIIEAYILAHPIA